MKKRLLALIAVLSMICAILPSNAVFAETVASGTCGENITWVLDSNGCLEISGNGDMTPEEWSGSIQYKWLYPWSEYEEKITEVKINSGITSIGYEAFCDYENIISVQLPDGMTAIDDEAFYYCGKLEKINIPKTVINIGYNAFGYCDVLSNVYYSGSKDEWQIIDISDGDNCLINANVTYASGICGDNATWALDSNGTLTISGSGEMNDYTNETMPWCTYRESLRYVIIEKGITRIGANAFYESSISNVSIPDSVQTIGSYAFYGCRNLEKIFFPDSVKALGTDVCNYCENLSEIRLSKELTRIPLRGFGHLQALSTKKIFIPKSIERIQYHAFGNYCGKFEVYYEGTREEWDNIYFEDDVDKILNERFNNVFNYDEINIESFGFSKQSLELSVGYIEKINLSILPQTALFKKIKWYSDDEDIAYVDVYGNVIGRSAGTTIIMAEDETGAWMDACVVEVTEPIRVNKIELDKNSLNIVEGDTDTLVATITPDNAKNKNIIWTSSNPSVATIENGVIRAISSGTAVITAKTEDGGFKDECIVNVETLHPITGIKFETTKMTLDAGSSENLKVIYTPENATYKDVTWSSSKPSVATVENGTIKAISAGTAIIVATSVDGGYKATCIVTVVQPVKVTGISLNETKKEMILGNSFELKATIAPSDATNKNVIWISNNEDIATVKNGVVTANLVGTAKITAKTEDGNYSASCVVTVLPIPITGVTLSKEKVSIILGNTDTIEANVIPDNVENKNVIWSSDNNDIATVENGVITAKSIGTTTITVTTEVGGFTASCVVEVLPVNVTDIELNKTEISITEGSSETINATVTPKNATNKNIIWTSNNEEVATVNNGVVTGNSVGTAVITAESEDGNYRKYCVVNVTAAYIDVKGITLDRSTLPIVEGYSETLHATIKPENATNQNIIWTSNNEKVATVNNGIVSGVAPGTAVIIATAEDSGQIATCIINVISAMQDSVSKPIASILSGAVQEGSNILLLCATRGAQIYYTTDGSTPTKESAIYTTPIKVDGEMKIKAIAFKDGMIDSDIASFSYTIADPNVPYVSVQTNLTGNKGDVTTVSVNISENSGSAGGSFNLVYDETAVELLSAESGAYINKANPTINDSYAVNKIRTVWAGMKPLTGGGEILTAQFRILDTTDKEAAYFSLEKLKISDDNAIKMRCQQGDGVLALVDSDAAIQDKEFSTESVLGADNKTLSIIVNANSENVGKLYAAVYDKNSVLVQIKDIDVKNNVAPYDIIFDKEIENNQYIKVFVWNENMIPLSDGETVQ